MGDTFALTASLDRVQPKEALIVVLGTWAWRWPRA